MAALALTVAKLFVVGDQEIRLFGDDDVMYAFLGAHAYWGTPYGQFAYARQPVYPLFITASSTLGLPLRVSIELAWAACAVVTARALVAVGLRTVSAILLVALILWSPWSIPINNRALADSLYAPVMLAFLAALTAAIVATASRSAWIWGAMAGLAGALAANMRPESVLVTESCPNK